MAIEQAREALRRWGAEGHILELPASSATVELAEKALRCEPAHIAKTLAFRTKEQVLLIVMAGDARVDNKKYKARFGAKAAMLPFDQTEQAVGHAPGGVCPFGRKPGIPVYLDVSLRRFSTVYPACGSANSAIALTIPELERYAETADWVDVCKDWREPAAEQ